MTINQTVNVVGETEIAWQVPCLGDCGTINHLPKRIGKPVDPYDPKNTEVVWEDAPAHNWICVPCHLSGVRFPKVEAL